MQFEESLKKELDRRKDEWSNLCKSIEVLEAQRRNIEQVMDNLSLLLQSLGIATDGSWRSLNKPLREKIRELLQAEGHLTIKQLGHLLRGQGHIFQGAPGRAINMATIRDDEIRRKGDTLYLKDAPGDIDKE